MIRDGFRCFSRERRIKSKKAWIDSFSNGFSTGSLYVDPRQKIVWSVKNSRMNTLKFCIFHYYFDYVFVECVYINISDHMNFHFHWKWSFHVLILSPLQAWRKLIKNWWFLIDLCTLTSGHEIMNWNSLGFHETSDFGENSLCWLSRSPSRSCIITCVTCIVNYLTLRVSMDKPSWCMINR